MWYNYYIGVQCPAGQHYDTCGNSCQRTCHDISTISVCKSTCVEGCFCPKGLTLSESGECIPVVECPCYNGGYKYRPGQKRIEASGNNGSQLCTCTSATWECGLAKEVELTLWKDISESSCNHRKHLTFTECEPPEPVTCRVRFVLLLDILWKIIIMELNQKTNYLYKLINFLVVSIVINCNLKSKLYEFCTRNLYYYLY